MRKRTLILLLLPLILILWTIGWTLLFVGNQETPTKKKEDNVTIMPVPYKETEPLTTA